MDTVALFLPLILLSRAGFAHYHLYRRLEPDPLGRFLGALRRYAAAVFLAFSSWAILQTALGILFEITSPILPMLIATIFASLFNRFILRVPSNWYEMKPYLSEDKSYHAFLKVVADRAAEVKGDPSKREAYLNRMYDNDQARMQAVGQFLAEHRDQAWITLKPHQLAYHPSLYRFPVTTLYLVALLPIIIPFLLRFYDPTVTAENFSLTVIASALASVLYSPLFDPDMLPIITGLAVAMIAVLAIGSEVARLRFMTPGLVGLLALAFLLCFVVSYVQTYVVERTDTPLMQVTDYALDKLDYIARSVDKADNFRGVVRLFGGNDAVSMVRNADQWIAKARQTVLEVQSRLGGLFILPALFFWTGMTVAMIREVNFSTAAQVTFRSRMRKPQV